MSSNRDNFTAKTKDTLAKRVGYLCSNPNCRKLTVGANEIEDKSTSVGVAAHITAASEGGPRYDGSLTKKQRIHINNGIWLCSNCATLIDKDPENYSTSLLRQWKSSAERESIERLEGNYNKDRQIEIILSNGKKIDDKLGVLTDRLVKEEKEEIRTLKELIASKERNLQDKQKVVELQDVEIIRLKTELSEKSKLLEESEKRFSDIFIENDGKDFSGSNELYVRALEALTNGNKQEALKILERQKLLEQKRELDRENEKIEKEKEQQAESWLLRAELLKNEDRWGEELDECYEMAAEILPNFYYSLKAANHFQFVNRYKIANDYYRICLQKAKMDDERAVTLNNLGNLQTDQNEFEKSEQSYEEALLIYRELDEVIPQTYLPDVAMTLNNLGTLQSDQNEFKKSEQSYQEALVIQRKLATVNPQTYLPDVATTLNNLGVLQNDQNEFEKSKASYEEALTIRRKLARSNRQKYLPYVATTLNNLGTLQSNQNEFEKSKQSYEEALTILRKLAELNPQTHLPDAGMILNNLAVLQSNQNKFEKSEVFYIEALRIYQKLAELNPQQYLPYVGAILNNLGVLRKDQNEYNQAEVFYKKALKIRKEFAKKHGGALIIDVAQTLYNLSFFYQSIGKQNKAIKSMTEVSEILGKYKDELPYVVPYYEASINFLKEITENN